LIGVVGRNVEPMVEPNICFFNTTCNKVIFFNRHFHCLDKTKTFAQMVKEIYLRSKKQETRIVLVDDIDFEELSRSTWCNSGGYAVRNHCGPGELRMHRVVMELQGFTLQRSRKWVVDHIDNNRLNNTRANLRIISQRQNAQNRAKFRASVSNYIGVSHHGMRWSVYACGTFVGFFNTEIAAAYAYDTAVLKLFDNPRINGVAKPPGFENFVPRTARFPKGVGRQKNGRWTASMYDPAIKRTKHVGTFDTMDEARDAVVARERVVAHQQELAHCSQPISRNVAGIAIFPIATSDGTKEILCDDVDWHELKRSTWCLNDGGYAFANVNGKSRTMHSLLLEVPEDCVVDHINRNRIDNRRTNLREATLSINSQNRTKQVGISSMYNGVSRSGRYLFRAEICKDSKPERLGRYRDEQVAAWVYNQRALELYGRTAKLNDVPTPVGWIYHERKGRPVDTSTGVIIMTRKSSKFFGVMKRGNSFCARYGKVLLGSYSNEVVAAWVRDCYARTTGRVEFAGALPLNNVEAPIGWHIHENRGVFIPPEMTMVQSRKHCRDAEVEETEVVDAPPLSKRRKLPPLHGSTKYRSCNQQCTTESTDGVVQIAYVVEG